MSLHPMYTQCVIITGTLNFHGNIVVNMGLFAQKFLGQGTR